MKLDFERMLYFSCIFYIPIKLGVLLFIICHAPLNSSTLNITLGSFFHDYVAFQLFKIVLRLVCQSSYSISAAFSRMQTLRKMNRHLKEDYLALNDIYNAPFQVYR